MNGPKSWSLAAELHPDVATAYEATQDRAARQIIGCWPNTPPRGSARAAGRSPFPWRPWRRRWCGITPLGPGIPHRHLHLQINARVFAADRWRGIDTVRGAGLDRRDQWHRARRGRLRPSVSGRPGCSPVHPGPGRDHPVGSVRGPVQPTGDADPAPDRPLRGAVDGCAPRRATRTRLAAAVGCPGLGGRGPTGQGHPSARGGPARPVARRARGDRVPRP